MRMRRIRRRIRKKRRKKRRNPLVFYS